MKYLALLFAFAAPLLAQAQMAAPMPRCWADEQPVQDGIFVVDYATASRSAQDFAQFLLSTQGIFATKVSVATDSTLNTIEIVFSSPDHPYQPSLQFPTLDSLKQYILNDFARVVSQPGITIRCAAPVQPQPGDDQPTAR